MVMKNVVPTGATADDLATQAAFSSADRPDPLQPPGPEEAGFLESFHLAAKTHSVLGSGAQRLGFLIGAGTPEPEPDFNPYDKLTEDFVRQYPYTLDDFEAGHVLGLTSEAAFAQYLMRKRIDFEDRQRLAGGSIVGTFAGAAIPDIAGGWLINRRVQAVRRLVASGRVGETAVKSAKTIGLIGAAGTAMGANVSQELALGVINPERNVDMGEALTAAAVVGGAFALAIPLLGRGIRAVGKPAGTKLLNTRWVQGLQKRVSDELSNTALVSNAEDLIAGHSKSLKAMLSETPDGPRSLTVVRSPETDELIAQVQRKWADAGHPVTVVADPQQPMVDWLMGLQRLDDGLKPLQPAARSGPMGAAAKALEGVPGTTLRIPGAVARESASSVARRAVRAFFIDPTATAETLADPLRAVNNPPAEALRFNMSWLKENAGEGIDAALREHFKAKKPPIEATLSDGSALRITRYGHRRQFGRLVKDLIHQQDEMKRGLRGSLSFEPTAAVTQAAETWRHYTREMLDRAEEAGRLQGPRALGVAEKELEELERTSAEWQRRATSEMLTEADIKRLERAEEARDAKRAEVQQIQTWIDNAESYVSRRWLRHEIVRNSEGFTERLVQQWQKNRRIDRATGKAIAPEEEPVLDGALRQADATGKPILTDADMEVLKGAETLGKAGERPLHQALDVQGSALTRQREAAEQLTAHHEGRLTEARTALEGATAEVERLTALQGKGLHTAKTAAKLEKTRKWQAFLTGKIDRLRETRAAADAIAEAEQSLTRAGERIAKLEAGAVARLERARVRANRRAAVAGSKVSAIEREAALGAAGASPLAAHARAAAERAATATARVEALQAAIADPGLRMRYDLAVESYLREQARKTTDLLTDAANAHGVEQAFAGGSVFKERTLQIDESNFREFLDNDLLGILNYYDHKVGGDLSARIAIRRDEAFWGPLVERHTGKKLSGEAWDPKLVLEAVGKDFQEMMDAARKADPDGGKGLQRLVEQSRNQTLKILDRKLEELRGINPFHENAAADAGWHAAGRIALRAPFMAMMGGMTVSSLADAAAQVMVARTSGDMIKAIGRDFIGMLPKMKMPRWGLEAFEVANEEGMSRLLKFAELDELPMDPRLATSAGGRALAHVDRLTDWAARKFGTVSLMNRWNTNARRVTAHMVMNLITQGGRRLVRAAELQAAGKGKDEALRLAGLSGADAVQLSRLGITPARARRLVEVLRKHGKDYDGNPLASLSDEQWAAFKGQISPEYSAWYKADPELFDVLTSAVNTEVRNIIVEPALLSRPLMNQRWFGKVVNQFWSFAYAWGNQFSNVAAQRPASQQATYVTLAVGLGGVIDALHNQLSGRRSFEDTARMWEEHPTAMLVTSADRAGLFGWLARPNALLHHAGVSPQKLLGNDISSMHAAQSLNYMGALVGPSFDYWNRVANGAITPALPGNEYDARTLHLLRTTVPFQNLFALSSVYQTTKAMGLENPMGPGRGIDPFLTKPHVEQRQRRREPKPY